MADTSRDIELRLRARDLSTAELRQVVARVNELSGALDKQLIAATKLEVKEKELRNTLVEFDQAAKNVAGLDATIKRYQALSEQVERNRADLQKSQNALQAHQAAMAAGTATGTAAERSLTGFQRAVAAAEKSLQTNQQSLERYNTSLRQAGIDTANLVSAEQQLVTISTAIGDSRTKLNATIRDYARLEREAREETKAIAAAQREAAETAKQEAAAVAQVTARRKEEADQLRSMLSGRMAANREQTAQLQSFNDETIRLSKERKEKEEQTARDNISAIRKEYTERRQAQERFVQDNVASNAKLNEETRKRVRERQADDRQAIRQRLSDLRAAEAEAAKIQPTRGENIMRQRQEQEAARARGGRQTPGILGLRPYEVQNLGYQINDVIGGLAQGQNVTQILAQQGGQFIQIFGRAALRWFPAVALAIGAVTLATEALTNRLQTLSSNREFTAALTANKYAVDQNATSLTALRRELRDLGVSWEEAGKTINVALSGNIRSDRMREVVLLARDMARVNGVEVPEAMRDLVNGLSNGVKGFDELLAKYPAIGEKNAEFIRGLLLAGKTAEAQREMIRLLGEEFRIAADQKMSAFDKSVEKLRTSWNRLLDRIGDSKAFDSLITKTSQVVDGITKLVEQVDKLDESLKKLAERTVINPLVRGLNPDGSFPLTPFGFVWNMIGAGGAGIAGGGPPAPTGGLKQNATTIQGELQKRGYSAAAIASIMGNLQIESGFDPEAKGPLGHRGIAQWDENRRKPLGGIFTDLMAQIELLDKELQAIDPEFKRFNGSIEEGTKRFRDRFEKPISVRDFGSPKDTADLNPRIAAARRFAGEGLAPATTGSEAGTRAVPSATGVTSGPTAAQIAAGKEALRIAERDLALAYARDRQTEERLKRESRLKELKDQGISDDAAAATVEKELAAFRLQKDTEEYERQQRRSKEAIQDGRERAKIEAAGAKAVADAQVQGITNYEKLKDVRDKGEAEARADIQKRKSELDQFDAAEKRIDDLRRANLRDHKSALDKITEAINLQYDNELKALEKLKERSSTVDQERYDRLIKRLEAERQSALARAPRDAAEQQGRESLAARDELVRTANRLFDLGEITLTEKENKVKEAFDLTRKATLESADALEKWLATAKELGASETEIAKVAGRVKEIRAESKYVDPFWKGLKETFTSSFSTAGETFFNGISEAIGGAIAKTKEWKDVWTSLKVGAANFFAQILRDLANYILKAQLAKLASSLFGGTSFGDFLGIAKPAATTAATSAATAATSAASTTNTGLFGLGFLGLHGGGVVGRRPESGRAPASWWAGAPRYHSGTLVGLAPDEQAAILKQGEEVLASDSPRNVLNGGGMGGVNFRAVLVDDTRRIPEAMMGAHGERVIVQHLVRNAATLREIVRG